MKAAARWGMLLALTVVGCQGAGTNLPAHVRTFPEGTPWPQSVEGVLEIAVEDGDVATDDISEVNFGSILTAEGAVLIDLRDDSIRAAGLSRDQLYQDIRVRAVLSGLSEHGGPTYRVSELQVVTQ